MSTYLLILIAADLICFEFTASEPKPIPHASVQLSTVGGPLQYETLSPNFQWFSRIPADPIANALRLLICFVYILA
jgi:hypothetical protein